MKKMFCILLAGFWLFWFSACGVGGAANPEYGRLEEFSYRFGGGLEGLWMYTLIKQETGVYIEKSMNDISERGPMLAPEGALEAVAGVVAARNIDRWNGFDEKADEVMDAYSFSLQAGYQNGSITAKGYGGTPRGYQKKHDALLQCLEEIWNEAVSAQQKADQFFEQSGAVTSFFYGFGSGMDAPYVEYELYQKGEKTMLKSMVSDFEEIPPTEVPGETLQQLTEVLREGQVNHWDGFDQSEEVADGYGYNLEIELENGAIVSCGYGTAPDNYNAGHARLKAFLEDLVWQLQVEQNARENEALTFESITGIYHFLYSFTTQDGQMINYRMERLDEGSEMRLSCEPEGEALVEAMVGTEGQEALLALLEEVDLLRWNGYEERGESDTFFYAGHCFCHRGRLPKLFSFGHWATARGIPRGRGRVGGPAGRLFICATGGSVTV